QHVRLADGHARAGSRPDRYAGREQHRSRDGLRQLRPAPRHAPPTHTDKLEASANRGARTGNAALAAKQQRAAATAPRTAAQQSNTTRVDRADDAPVFDKASYFAAR